MRQSRKGQPSRQPSDLSRLALARQRELSADLRARAWAGILGFQRGPGVRFGPGVTVNLEPGAVLSIGRGTFVAAHTYLHVAAGAVLRIGDNVFLGHNCMIMVKQEVVIGAGCAIAEQVAIRDHDHRLSARPSTGGLTISPVLIGNHVWVASKVTITRGVTVGEGAALAAGAIVTRDVAARTLVAGVPARLVRVL